MKVDVSLCHIKEVITSKTTTKEPKKYYNYRLRRVDFLIDKPRDIYKLSNICSGELFYNIILLLGAWICACIFLNAPLKHL